MLNERLQKQIGFIIELDKMKSVFRQTLLIDHTRHENDAEHSWHFAMCALLLREYAAPEVNVDRAIRMALVHDLIEIYAGDTFAVEDYAEFFYNGRMDNGLEFGYTVEIVSINNDANGIPTATVRVTRK